MTPPDGRRAGDVGAIRDFLVEGLKGSIGREIDEWAALNIEHGMPAPTSTLVEQSGLTEAKLFWVPPDETAVIGEAATDLPADLVLTEDMLPSLSGFVVFGGNWYGIDAQTNTKSIYPIRAFRWGPVNLPSETDSVGFGTPDSHWVRAIAISAYSYTLDIRDAARATMSREELAAYGQALGYKWIEAVPTTWMPLGRSDWAIGCHWRDHPTFGPSHKSYASVIEDRCLMTALWALMNACAPIEHVPNRAERRRAERRGTLAQPVRIVTWRGPQGQRVVTQGEAERHQGVRYPVRPHWRNARVGPGRSQRRWVYIPRHWRGPEDAPLASPHETIHKIVSR